MTSGVHQVWECIFTQKLVDKVVTDTVYIKMILKTITLLLSQTELQHATDTGNLGNTVNLTLLKTGRYLIKFVQNVNLTCSAVTYTQKNYS